MFSFKITTVTPTETEKTVKSFSELKKFFAHEKGGNYYRVHLIVDGFEATLNVDWGLFSRAEWMKIFKGDYILKKASRAKSAAAKRNGKKGGRPPKKGKK